MQSRNRDIDVESGHMDTRGDVGDGMNWEIRTDIYTAGLPLVAQMVENLPAAQRPRSNPWVKKIPWKRK